MAELSHLHLVRSLDDEPGWEFEGVLNHRLVKRGRKTKVEYLLTFNGYGPEHNFWQATCKGLLGYEARI